MVAAWPAASLVGSYELLLWLIRSTATSDMTHERPAGQPGGPADHPSIGVRLVPAPDTGSPESAGTATLSTIINKPTGSAWLPGTADRASEPGDRCPDQSYQPGDQAEAKWSGPPATGTGELTDPDADGAAVAAYQASLKAGEPLSERKLAAMFGKTSRRGPATAWPKHEPHRRAMAVHA